MDAVIVFLTALTPLLIGFIWYNTKVFGAAWMKENNLNEEELKKGNMIKILGLTYLLGLFISVCMMLLTIHQVHLGSIVAGDPDLKDPNSALSKLMTGFMEKYGNNYRTFKHGFFHGFMTSIFLVLPVIGINALFERRSFKYVMIHLGYWAITMGIMGGIICQFIKIG
jgi:Protein of unknown function (DUF1761)